MKRIAFIILLVLSFFVAGNLSKAFAVEAPSFPLCSNPQGEVIASYQSGSHGVPGDSTTYLGEDTVYKINENQILQCLCATDGSGVQTNWWKFEALSEDQIDILKSEGWILVPDGSAWGLDPVPYFAKNADFSCDPPQQGNVGGPGDGLSDGKSDGKSDGRSDGMSDGRGGISMGVLGLATTGNYVFILTVLLTGMLALSIGLILRLKK